MSEPLSLYELSEIAKGAGLTGDRFNVYIEFMKKRFPFESDIVYALEWARRFNRGDEYIYADEASKAILCLVDYDLR